MPDLPEIKQLVLKSNSEAVGATYNIKDQTARTKTENALYYTVQSLTSAQKNQVYTNLDLENCATLEYVVVS